jgi:hypothetical protein
MDNEKDKFMKEFGKIRNTKDKILEQIDKEAEKNDILKEILIYIFELRINSYFEDCLKLKFIKNSPIKLLLGLNFDYYKNCCLEINKRQYGELKTLGMLYYFSFIRCYLYYFVKLQIENEQLGDLSSFHEDLFKISESNLGKLISLYIAKLFFLYDKKELFLNKYLKDDQNNWKSSLFEKNDKIQLFSINNNENSNHFLLDIYSEIVNQKKLTSEFLHDLEIIDLTYIINFCYNEISQKRKNDKIEKSKLIEEINKVKDGFTFKKGIKNKIMKILEKLSDEKIYEDVKENLILFFNMIKIYIIGFIGKEQCLTAYLYSHDLKELIEIFYKSELEEKNKQKIINYYEIKEYIEENRKTAYLCKCGKWFNL